MSDEYLTVYFPYREGNSEDLKTQHIAAFDSHDDFDVSSPFIESAIGKVSPSSTDVPAITGMSFLEHYTYEGANEGWDLLYSPMVKYYLGDLSVLKARRGLNGTDPLETLVDIIVTGYEATDQQPLATVVITPPHGHFLHTPPFTATSLAHDEYHHLSWITVFTPPMVDTYGRETLLSTPAWKTEELVEGSILVVCHDDTVHWKADRYDVAEHIGIDWFKNT